jgi:hypothetical protein
MKVYKYSLLGNLIIESYLVIMICSIKLRIGNFEITKFSFSKSYNSKYPKNELILTKYCLFVFKKLLFLIFIKKICE